jgi:glycosyltransferase involved in cell wall biosynthesis
MRILVVSNFFPPYYIGGYELGCLDVVKELRARGHTVAVLTSTWGAGRRTSEDGVYRWLDAQIDWEIYSSFPYLLRLAQKEKANRRALAKVLREFKPDLVYLWNLRNLSITLAFYAQDQGLPCCYFIFDHWLANWESDPWFSLWKARSRSAARQVRKDLARSLLRVAGLIPPGDLHLTHVQFASHYLKRLTMDTGKKMPDAHVIHWGVDLARFPYQPREREPKRILFAGQVVPEKGVRTAIEAMHTVVNANARRDVRLTIVGGSRNPDYVAELHKLTTTYGLRQHVEFAGPVPREQLPALYQEHDILIFPSVWEEPFGIVLLEAFSSGLAVVATATGGSAEIVEDQFNALVFPPGDANSCAQRVLQLLCNPGLAQRIRRNGRRTVEMNFCFQPMVDAIEDSLERIAAENDMCRSGNLIPTVRSGRGLPT